MDEYGFNFCYVKLCVIVTEMRVAEPYPNHKWILKCLFQPIMNPRGTDGYPAPTSLAYTIAHFQQ